MSPHASLSGRRCILALAASLALAAPALPRHANAQSRKVTIAIQYGYAYLPVTLADKQGLFVKHAATAGLGGIAFDIQRISGAPAINDALISGTVEIGAYGLPGMLIAWEKTRGRIGVRGLAGLVVGDNALFASRADIKGLEDFRPNDRISVTATNSQQAIVLRMAAEKVFGDAKRMDTMMVALPHPEGVTALLTGNMAGYIGPEPYMSALAADPRAHKLFEFASLLGTRMTSGLLASTDRVMKQMPGLAGAVVAALDEANGIIRADPDAAARLFLASEKSILSPADMGALLRRVGDEFQTQPSGAEALGGFMHRTEQLKSVPASWRDAFFAPVNERPGS